MMPTRKTCLQDNERAQASGTFCKVVRIKSIHIPCDQWQFLIIFFCGFTWGGWALRSQIYAGGIFKDVNQFNLVHTGRKSWVYLRVYSSVNLWQSGETDSRFTILLEASPQLSSLTLGWSLSLVKVLLQILSPCPPQRMSSKLSAKTSDVQKPEHVMQPRLLEHLS